jgi:hypothetical protein
MTISAYDNRQQAIDSVINGVLSGAIDKDTGAVVQKLFDSSTKQSDGKLRAMLAGAVHGVKFKKSLVAQGLLSKEILPIKQFQIEEKYKCKAKENNLVTALECKEYSEGPLHSSHCNTCMRFEPEKIINVPAQEKAPQKQIESAPPVKKTTKVKAKLTLDVIANEHLPLSFRTANILNRVFGNEYTIATLCNTSDEELLKIHSFGNKALGEVRIAIGEFRTRNKIK